MHTPLSIPRVSMSLPRRREVRRPRHWVRRPYVEIVQLPAYGRHRAPAPGPDPLAVTERPALRILFPDTASLELALAREA